jgi:aminoglycoside 6'-N-acetyltransferase I
MRMMSFPATQPHLQEQMAALLVAAFREHWPEAWPEMDSAREEVAAFASAERLCCVALDDVGSTVLGWVGGLPQYDGHVWELHPLAVHPRHQRRGVGRALTLDLEARVHERGGLTIMLGTDDEADMTSLSQVNLYDDLWRHVVNIRNLRGHPYEFYQKMGFVIVGVVPDANGRGKPDILMAKRVGA